MVGLPIVLLALGSGLWIGGQKADSTTPLIIIAVFLLVITMFSIVRGIQKQKKLWSSYRIILDESSIKKVQDALPDVTIAYGEIVKIMEGPGFGLSVHADSARQIGIPATLEDYDQLRLELSGRHSFESIPQVRTRWMQFSPTVAVLATIIGFLVTFLSSNPYISASAGILLFIGLVVSLVQIGRNPQVAKQMKWQTCFIIFPLFGIAARVLMDILLIIDSIYKF